jgi:hypothetical protein
MLLLILSTMLTTTPASSADGGEEGFRIIHSDQLEQMLHAGKPEVHLYDANHDEFRNKEGIIPGAVLLTNAHDYDLAKTLPADKSATLVFYCSNKL